MTGDAEEGGEEKDAEKGVKPETTRDTDSQSVLNETQNEQAPEESSSPTAEPEMIDNSTKEVGNGDSKDEIQDKVKDDDEQTGNFGYVYLQQTLYYKLTQLQIMKVQQKIKKMLWICQKRRSQ